MWYIVGLGNPGKKYEKTRHNVGFFVIDSLAKQHNITFRAKKRGLRRLRNWLFSAKNLTASGYIAEEEVTLVKPITFMNRSGEALISLFKQKPQIDIKKMLVIVDDINLPLGKLRFRPKGSDGGHNGLASIIAKLQTKEFPRLRIGIGEPTNQAREDYVLRKFSKKEFEIIDIAVQKATDAIETLIKSDIQTVMNEYN